MSCLSSPRAGKKVVIAGLQIEKALGVIYRGLSLDRYALQEVGEPPVPVAVRAYAKQTIVILGSASLEISRDVEQRLREEPPLMQQQRDIDPRACSSSPQSAS